MDLVVFAHPESKISHNAVILDYVRAYLERKKRQYRVIDLYKDGFDPVLRLVDESHGVAGYGDDVRRYQAMISESERVVFIYPVWWYNMPAIMKGFIDRIFTSGFAFEYKLDGGWNLTRPKLTGKKAVIINTFGHGERLYKEYGGSTDKVLDDTVLGFCGMKTVRVNWFDIHQPSSIPESVREQIDKALE